MYKHVGHVALPTVPPSSAGMQYCVLMRNEKEVVGVSPDNHYLKSPGLLHGGER